MEEPKMKKGPVLAIETSQLCGGVAIVEDEVLGEVILSSKETHSKRLLSAISYLLKRLGLKLKDLSAIAVSIGPGSFTGLRIGLATAKGLCLGSGIPLIGIGTLEAMAANIYLIDRPICPIIDARRKQIYTAIYRFKNSQPEEILPPSLIFPKKLVPFIKEETIFLGDGLKQYGSYLSEALGKKFIPAPSHLAHPRPAAVGYLAWQRILRNETDDPQTLVPIYLRPSEAELKFIERQ